MMTGKLVRWNDEKGYGFIRAESESRDVFIHISVLAQMSRRPVAGDVIFFDIETDPSGKCKATSAKIEGVPRLETPEESWSLAPVKKNPRLKPEPQSTQSPLGRSTIRTSHQQNRRPSLPTKLIPLLIIIIAVVTYEKFSTPTMNRSVIARPMPDANRAAPEESGQTQTQFQCQGKTHCSQMTSCAEATFYLTHCPGTEMDGDHDGIPCESQWCN